MNPFAKAAVLTVVVLILTLLLVSQIDSLRESDLQTNINELEFEMESNRLLARYGEVMADDDNRCEFLNYTENLQEKKAFSIAYTLQEYERANLVGDEYESLKRSYFASLTDLYITSFENIKSCPNLKQVPVAFFYTQSDCPSCQVQGQVLSSAAQKCSNVRVFAFASDSNYPFLKLLAERYEIHNTPALIINDSLKINGVSNEKQLISELERFGAVCR